MQYMYWVGTVERQIVLENREIDAITCYSHRGIGIVIYHRSDFEIDFSQINSNDADLIWKKRIIVAPDVESAVLLFYNEHPGTRVGSGKEENYAAYIDKKIPILELPFCEWICEEETETDIILICSRHKNAYFEYAPCYLEEPWKQAQMYCKIAQRVEKVYRNIYRGVLEPIKFDRDLSFVPLDLSYTKRP
jgi:hypothetical protein